MRVLVDLLAVDRELDYLLPPSLGAVEVGTIVRVPLAGRKVRSWVTAVDVTPPTGLQLKKVAAVVGAGPEPDLVELSRWAAWRWAGRRVRFFRTASPERIVRMPDRSSQSHPAQVSGAPGSKLRSFTSTVLRVPPAGDDVGEILPLLRGWTEGGRSALVLVPEVARIGEVAARLRSFGVAVAEMPKGWQSAASGGHVAVGARAAAWAPAPRLGGVAVLDAHEELFREESAPTWDAVAVAEMRARRAGVPFLAVSPCPTVALLEGRRLQCLSRSAERAGWAPLVLVDLAREDPRKGLFSAPLLRAIRSSEATDDRRVVCVLNRRGRATFLVCSSCHRPARCEDCTVALREEGESLACPGCSSTRPVVCASCGATRLKRVRPGVTRIAEELARLTGVEVAEVSSATDDAKPGAAVIVGTEAVLHRERSAGTVAFIDFDTETLAPRLGAGEAALGLLARASRMVGGRSRGATVIAQTRVPEQEVFAAAIHADPALLTDPERRRRKELELPPFSALALVSGPGARTRVEQLAAASTRNDEGGQTPHSSEGGSESLVVAELGSGGFLVRARSHDLLCDALARGEGSTRERVRIDVDPRRI